jgi:hypothetical protein
LHCVLGRVDVADMGDETDTFEQLGEALRRHGLSMKAHYDGRQKHWAVELWRGPSAIYGKGTSFRVAVAHAVAQVEHFFTVAQPLS